jgi:mRNA interferase MazF
MQPANQTIYQEGEIVLAALAQANGQYKLRPVLLLRRMPGYGDLLACGLSSKLNQFIPGFGELLQPDPANGLRVPSVIRLEFLHLLPSGRVQGLSGRVPDTLLHTLRQRLADYLTGPHSVGPRSVTP